MTIPKNDVVPTTIPTLTRVSTIAITIIITIIIATIIPLTTSTRELRPSDHGLPFQSLPPRSPETALFFNETISQQTNNPPIITSNSTDTDSGWDDSTPGTLGRESKVRKTLVVVTIAFGGTGVALLLVAGILFGIHFYRKRINNNDGSNSVTAVTVIPAPHK